MSDTLFYRHNALLTKIFIFSAVVGLQVSSDAVGVDQMSFGQMIFDEKGASRMKLIQVMIHKKMSQ